MKNKSRSIAPFLTIDALILFLCYTAIYFLIDKPSLPFKLSESNGSLIVLDQSGAKNIKSGDLINSIEGHELSSLEEIELLLDSKKVGNYAEVVYKHKGEINSELVKLINYYSSADIIAYALIGTLFLLIGFFVLYKCYDRKSARVFHWVSVATAMVILMTPGIYGPGFSALGYLTRFLFYTSYCLVPAIFIHFTIVFPVDREKNNKAVIYTFYSLAALLAIVLNALFLNAVITGATKWFNYFIMGYNIFRMFVIISIITAIVIFARSFKLAVSVSEKKKLKWLLLGFILGPFTYLLFWVIPYLIFGKSFIPEIVVILLLSAVPITFTISIVKYHLMDIDIIMNRSIVYTIAIGGLVAAYVALVTLITSLFGKMDETIPSIFSAVTIALIFQPVRALVQKNVDKYFFRVQYDFRQALKEFMQEIKDAARIDDLINKLVQRTYELIPVEKIAYFSLKHPENRVKILEHKNFDMLAGRSVKFQEDKLKTNLSQPVALINKVEPGANIEEADRNVFSRWGMVLVFPVKSVSGLIFGFLVLGEKKSGLKFTIEDIDLLNTVISEVALTIERIKLQEDLLIEILEKQKLNELNEMKSFFVSSVSHDLKTPLTSIKMFTELLKIGDNIPEEKKQDYFRIIDGESNRLTRLIDSVLDFTKIEKGVKNYDFEITSLECLAKEVLETMDYQFKMNNFSVSVSYCESENFINADKDSLKEAIINLLSNSIKYSDVDKNILIKTFNDDGFACLSIEDKGIGIAKDNIKNIFEPFFRAGDLKGKRIGGTGIGLTIVKHIMDAHNGRIDVKSELGKGSCFTLMFPLKSLS